MDVQVCNSKNKAKEFRIKIENHLNPIAEKDLEIMKLMDKIEIENKEENLDKLKRYFKVYFKVEWNRIKQEADIGEKEFTDSDFLEKWGKIERNNIIKNFITKNKEEIISLLNEIKEKINKEEIKEKIEKIKELLEKLEKTSGIEEIILSLSEIKKLLEELKEIVKEKDKKKKKKRQKEKTKSLLNEVKKNNKHTRGTRKSIKN